MDYDLELQNAIDKINKENSKLVCIQLPDGLKQYSEDIQIKLQQETEAKILIWAGSCYGACDLPVEVRQLGVDLIIQWGHSEWR